MYYQGNEWADPEGVAAQGSGESNPFASGRRAARALGPGVGQGSERPPGLGAQAHPIWRQCGGHGRGAGVQTAALVTVHEFCCREASVNSYKSHKSFPSATMAERWEAHHRGPREGCELGPSDHTAGPGRAVVTMTGAEGAAPHMRCLHGRNLTLLFPKGACAIVSVGSVEVCSRAI